MSFNIRDIDWKAVGSAAVEFFWSLLRGDLLLRMRVDKLFPYILYTFALAWVSIWLSYKVEQTMLQVEKNKAVIEEMKIDNARKTYEIVGINRISKVETMLRDKGSDVKAPEKPADILR